MRASDARWAYMISLVIVIGGTPRAVDAVDCSERFPVGRFALTQSEVAPLAAKVTGFSPVYLRKKPVQVRSSPTGDPCQFVYGFDVFEFTGGRQAGDLVAGCSGDFDADGARDYVVLLRRQTDGLYVPHIFLARGGTFQVITLEPHGGTDWFGPFCSPKPHTGIFEGPDFEGQGEGVRVRVFGDLITVGWSTYYWRPDLKRFDAILTTD